MRRNEQIHGFWYVLLFSGVITIDRVSKNWALEHCQESYYINDFLSFDLLFNRGISWGMFHSESRIIFGFVSCLIAAIVLALGLYTFVRWNNTRWVVGEVMVVAGTISNLIDRAVYPGVIDFIALSLKGYCWPVFNIADAFIVSGVILMIVTSLWES